jgi:sterol 3beta-glucosyltransferase
MKVFILVYGTRGDVQPCVALACALNRAGHDVTLAGPASFESWVAGYSVKYAPLHDGLTRLWDNPQMRESQSGVRGLPAVRAFAEAVHRPRIPEIPQIVADAWSAAQGADVVVHSAPLLASASHHIAEALGVPLALCQMYPLFTPTSEFPAALYRFPGEDRFPAALTRATYRALLFMLKGTTGRDVDAWRERILRLPHRRRNLLRRPDGGPVPVLSAISAHVLRPPRDWPDWVHTTGFWFLPPSPDWTPPAALADFLTAGEPPVYVGFGSMASRDSQGMGRMVVEAVNRAKVRAVLATGGGGLAVDDPSADVFVVDQVPHDWLFSRVSAVVHHGGPGTAAVAIAEGRPQVICPFMADQPFWGKHLHRSGLACAPVRSSTLTAADLTESIRTAIGDSSMAAQCRTMASLVRTENGADAAVSVLEEVGRKTCA